MLENKKSDSKFIKGRNTIGITLIALVVTIVVLLILSGITINFVLGDNGILTTAKEAAFKTEIANLKDDLSLFVTGKQLASGWEFSPSTLNASTGGAYYETEEGMQRLEGDIKTVLPSLKKEREEQIEIIKGEIVFSSQNRRELEWAKQMGIGINPYYIVDGELKSSDLNLMLMGEDGVLALPTTITKIADGTFSRVEGIRKVIIPGNVKEIGDYAFYQISTLEEVVMEEGIEKIGNYAFSGCTSLDNVKMPNTITTLGAWAFDNDTSLTNVTLSGKLTSLSNACFYYCKSLDNVILPDSIEVLSYQAFRGCKALKNIQLSDNLKKVEGWSLSRYSNRKNRFAR